MEPGFSVGSNQQIKASNTSKSADQMFEEKLTSYVKSTSRTPPSSTEIREAFTQLSSQKMTLQSFCKNLLNSTNTNDLKMVSTLAEKLNIPITREETAPAPKQSKPDNNMPGKAAQIAEDKQFQASSMSTVKIFQTSAGEHVLTDAVVKFLKQGNSKDALSTLESKPAIAGKVLESFGNMSQLSAQDGKTLMAFMQGIMANPGLFAPDVLAEIKKKYDKLRKQIDGSDEISGDDADLSGLSEDAKKFVKSFTSLTQMMKQGEAELSQEVADSYGELLARLGIKEEE